MQLFALSAGRLLDESIPSWFEMDHGWVYAEGITHWEVDDKERLLLAGHDNQGRLAVALELSLTPFK